MSKFRILAANPANILDSNLPVAASRAGHTGVFDLSFADFGVPAVGEALKRFLRHARGGVAVKLGVAQLDDFLSSAGAGALGELVLVPDGRDNLAVAIEALREAHPAIRVAVEVRNQAEADLAEKAGADLLVAKGHEAGGVVGDETAFLLVQRLAAGSDLPVIGHGGVSVDTAAAFAVAGASGVLLDWQLSMTEECALPDAIERVLRRLDGSETYLLGADSELPTRVFARSLRDIPDALQELDRAGPGLKKLPAAIAARVDPLSPESSLWLIGQDAAFAAGLARQFRRVGAVLDAVAEAAVTHPETAAATRALAPGGPLAKALGTEYPIVQGPMTRVSDQAKFADAVATAGGLPFLALALMRRGEADALVAETGDLLGDKPWGVGILGFVDEDLRAEQMEIIAQRRPRFALIAGGRPEQSRALESAGIPTFLHVPSPGLLKLFLEAGVRRFVFEGRECGGHVGPRSSAVLWQQAIDEIKAFYGDARADDCEVLFAGGIHDDTSAAMVAALAAPITSMGVKIGVLMGTAYILTKEAVSTGAVVEEYQSLALNARTTRLLESGVGHATRVVESPIVNEFYTEKARLRAKKTDPEEIKDRLERFNVGRSRIASKGVDRNPDFGKVDGAPKLLPVSKKDQRERGLYMIGQVANLHDSAMTMAELHDNVTAGAVSKLDTLVGAPADTGPEIVEHPGARIAITGIGTILPGASNLPEYWENILDRRDAITEVPGRRWDWRRYFDEDRDAPDKTYSRWGGFVDEIEFDPIRYGIPPKSMPHIEPLQLLALEAVRSALEDAGFEGGVIPDPDLRRRTCVIIGVGGGAGPLGQKYAVRSSLPAIDGGMSDLAEGRLPEWTEDSFPGILLNVIAGRIANRFDLGGVNFTVDAACGSSLAAVMLAAREIETGSADMAIVGGVDSFQNPFDFLAFAKTRALSPRGKCRTFDATADGIAISEGLAVMVLRPQEAAEKAGDRVYAVLRGVAGASDGRDLSLTAPRAEGQQETLRRAYRRAGISPATVSIVEAHGTGTVVGDRTEIESLTSVFAGARADKQFCGVGSVKSMIGHTKAAAGCAGLAKMALALHHRVLPSTLNVEDPNPSANFAESPFYVLNETRPWFRQDDVPRRAGVSAFGFGGTNFHAVLEEYDGGYLPKHQEPFRRNWTHELYAFSADTVDALINRLQSAATGLLGLEGSARPAEVAASLAATFDANAGARLVIVASSLSEVAERIAKIAGQLDPKDPGLRAADVRGCYFSAERPLEENEVAFLLPGQGSQYTQMAAGLTMTFPEVREGIERASATLAGDLPDTLASLIYPRPVFTDEERADQEERLKQTNVAQPAIGAVSAAVLSLCSRLGLSAGQVTGHSFGEYTALHAAGAFDEATLVRLAFARGDAILTMGGDDLGAMLAVTGDEATVANAVGEIDGVVLANINAPDQTVIAGPTPAIEAAAETLDAKGLKYARLPVACGFHSACVAPARDRLAEHLRSAPILAPEIPVVANATAAPYPAEPEEVKDLLAEHLVAPVNFVGGVKAMHDNGARLFVEVGPGSVLTRLATRILGEKPHLAVSTDVKGRQNIQQFLVALGAASAAGRPLALEELFKGRVDRAVDTDSWTLIDDQKKSALLWMVDPANVRPLDGKTTRVGFAARIEDDPVPSVPLAPPAEPTVTPAVAAQPVIAPSRAAPARSDGVEAVLRQHQELMQKFLQNHRDVMMSWIGGRPGSEAAASLPDLGVMTTAPTPVVADTPVAESMPVPAPAAPTPTPKSAPAPAPELAPVGEPSSPGLSETTVSASLLTLISDRTGYPSDMLDADLDLEADLGIDSIKRVEILGALRLQWLADAGEAAHERMGPVSRERTVRGIVTKFMEVAEAVGSGASAPAAAAPPSNAQPARVTALSEDAVSAALLALISERTGYPEDMLDADLDLEADLGIDSIKRVEILGALRLQWLSEAGEAAHERMGPVSRERTVRGIVGRFMEVAEAVGAGAAASSDPGPAVSVPVSPSAPSDPAAEALSKDAVSTSLLALISERTGYPEDMLDADLDLEADLGIDSIKRVEILGALRLKWLAEAGEAAHELMGPVSRERTVRGIVAKFMEVAEAVGALGSVSSSQVTPVLAEARSQGPATPKLSEEAVSVSLLALISDRTGYPEDMLDADLDLEADLGIDSIKRVEILGALRLQWLADAGEAAHERMGPVSRERTVRGIVAKFMEVADAFQGTGEALHPAEDTANGIDDWPARFVMVPRRTIVAPSEPAIVEGRVYILAGPAGPDLSALAEQIVKAGGDVLPIHETDDAALRAAVSDVASRLGGIFHLWPLSARGREAEMSASSWAASVRQDAFTLYTLLSEAGDTLDRVSGAFIVCASKLGGCFGFDGAATGMPTAAGAPGLMKAAFEEWDGLHLRAVDLEGDCTSERVAEILLAEAGRPGGRVEIGWKGDVRFELLAEPRPLTAETEAGAMAMADGDVVFVTGGARGITARIVCHLARNHRLRFVLLGSSRMDTSVLDGISGEMDARAIRLHLVEKRKSAGQKMVAADIEAEVNSILKTREMQSTLDTVRAAGCDVEYIAADVRDAEAFRSAIEDVYARYGQIDVALHGAGIIEDKLISEKTLESFERVVRTKTDSAHTLTRALRMESVKSLVLFASVAGRFGNRGQGDYGAANEILSKLARSLDARVPGRVLAIAWGPWDNGGMVTDEVKAQFMELGIEAIDPERGVAALEAEILYPRSAEPEVVWGRGPWENDIASYQEVAE